MLWKSKNGKHVITKVEEVKLGYDVHTTYLTHNVNNILTFQKVDGEYKVTHFTGNMNKLPKMIVKAGLELIEGKKKHDAAATTTLEEVANHVAYQPKTLAGLTNIAKDFLEKEYGLELTVPIKRNNRLSRALGRFIHTTEEPISIEIAGDMFNYYKDEEVIDVLKHELVHYALYTLGQPYEDGHPNFENELKRLGVTRTNVYKIKGERHVYTCKGCGKTVAARAKRINSTKLPQYYSKCCKQGLSYKGKLVIN